MATSEAISDSVSGDGAARGFRRGSSGFASQLNGFLHRRLRLCAGVLGAATLLVFANAMITHVASGRSREVGLFDASRLTLLGCVLVAALFVVVLSRKELSTGALLAVDAGLAWGTILGCVMYYQVGWTNGPLFVVPILGLFLLARAIFVPCRARRTFWLSFPAIPAILTVQLMHGDFYSDIDLRNPDSSFGPLLAWNQVVLILSVGLATVTSRVSFQLRRRVYEATQLGQYQLEERIGEGAMGEVYRARHAMMRRPTAVKVMRAGLVDDQTISRFEQEVRQTARLTHPNTIAIYDYGRTPEGTFYYAMELLPGEDLKEIVLKAGPMPPARVIHIMAQACAALTEAHARGLVHRDIKPGNIILCERGLRQDVVKVMDFGLVKDTWASETALPDAGDLCGTPETMAPETIRGREIRPAADIYALGAVGCFLLTGKPIFDAESVPAFVNMHLNEAPIAPSARGVDVPESLERILLSCLAKEPQERPASTAALRAALLTCEGVGTWTEDDATACWRAWRREQRSR